ncbi:hypothetical protein F3J28_20095 [Enterobacter sp. Ap-1006]|uniref:hypothetical protein n=1 Tax=Enterobacter sp. Ap-1006 TaxID=2608345 RepID=UPI001421B02D|nr:hypothetical protein [Enterobacter sp. Ap-1006]NIF50064.1 hypothetical protein [Enterobacter sp. Ap-1006]
MDIKNSIIILAVYIIILASFITLIVFKRWYKLDHKNLFSQELFWFAILTPVFSFFYFGIFSWKGHLPQFDNEGMNNFIAISKLPLLLLASSVPLGAIVTNLHRTYQTEAQIKTAETKNQTDGYYAHNKYHVEFLGKVNYSKRVVKSENDKTEQANNLNLSVAQPHSLYKRLFPDSSPTLGPQYTPSNSTIKKINILLDNNINAFKALDSNYYINTIGNGVDENNKELKKIRITLLTLCAFLYLNDDIKDITIIDTKSRNPKLCMIFTILRMRLICIKISVVLLEILDIYGINKQSHPDLINKVKSFRSSAKEARLILDQTPLPARSKPLKGVLTSINEAETASTQEDKHSSEQPAKSLTEPSSE